MFPSRQRSGMLQLLAVVVVLSTLPSPGVGHGRLMDPPARNSMWRLGFSNPVNYNDNELYCGGRMTQWARNKGKCGVCGDPHHSNRDHEVGGKYANGIISREYSQGDLIDATVHITANHKGYFEFRICPVQDPKVEVTQECLDKNVLQVTNGEGTRFLLPEEKSNQFFNVSLRLPADMICKQCVIQWKYRTANTWDKDENGKFCVGCGPQEEFYNCADVMIHPKGRSQKGSPVKHTDTQSGKNEVTNDKAQYKKTIEFSDDEYKQKMFDKNKIKDQARQNENFMHELHENKYSTWNDPEKSDIKDSKASFESPTEFNRRFGYVDRRHSDFSSDEKGRFVFYQPSSVSNWWKAGFLGVSDSDKTHYLSDSSNDISTADRVHGWNEENSEEQLEDVTVTSSSFNDDTSKTDPGQKAKEQKKYNQYQVPTASSPHGISELDVTHGHTSVTSISSDHKAVDRAAIKPRTQLGSMHNKEKMNPEQQHNFIRKWKLMRLRHIAALKALNATNTFTSPNPKQHVSNKQQMKEHSSTRMAPFEIEDGSQNNKEIIQDHNLDLLLRPTITAPSKTTSQSSRQAYLKKKLPSWLVQALKVKEKTETENSDYYNNYYTDRTRFSKYHTPGFDETISQEDKYAKSGTYLWNKHSEHDATERNNDNKALEKSVLSGQKMKDDDSTSIIKNNNKDKSNEKTESLVRYILSLLLSQKSGKALDEVVSKTRDADTRSQHTFDDIKMTKMQDSAVGNSRFEDYPSTDSEALSESRADMGKGMEKDHLNVYPEAQYRTEISSLHTDDVQSRKPAVYEVNQAPSVRAESHAFNGLILGSDYTQSQGLGNGGSKNSHNRKNKRPYERDNIINVQTNNRKDNPHHDGSNYNNFYQQQTQYTNYNKPNYHKQVEENMPQSRWTNTQSDVLTEKPVDYNHLWSGRALSRQGYYTRQQEAVKSLFCKSLVALGGGMDRWCTDNCNANFCPPSMCVCTTRIPEPVSYVSDGRSLLASQSGNLWHRSEPAVQEKPRENVYVGQVYNSEAGDFVQRRPHLNTNRKLPPYAPVNNRESYNKPYVSLNAQPAPKRRSLVTSRFGDNKENMQFLPLNLIDSNNGHIQGQASLSQSEHILDSDVGQSKFSDPYYPRNSAKMIGHHSDYDLQTSNRINRKDIQHPIRRYHDSKAYLQLPPFVNNRNTDNYQRHSLNKDSQGSWSSNIRKSYGSVMQSQSQDKERGEITSMIQPYKRYNLAGQTSSGLVSAGVDVPGNDGSLSQSYLSQKQLYPQVSDRIRQTDEKELELRLTCQAKGAYAGLKHFDEWCESTCMSAMCPLLICSCTS